MIILYYLLFTLVWLLSLLPLRILYLLADGIYFFVYYLFKYRRKTVRENLISSFPNKSKEEIKKIEKQFYHHFCDSFFETIKRLTISEKQIKKRIHIINPDAIEEYYSKNKSIFLYLGHYANWEWLTCGWTVNQPKYADYKMYSAYYPLSNKYTEHFFQYLRSRKTNGILVPQKKMLRTIIKVNQQGEKGIFNFIADQSPIWNSVQHWTKFLNHDTATIVGTEKLAKQMGYPVFYYKVRRIKRGYYSCEFIKIAENANEVPEFKLTEKFFAELEKSIIEAPAYWLWTHRRWKFDITTFYNIYPVKPPNKKS